MSENKTFGQRLKDAYFEPADRAGIKPKPAPADEEGETVLPPAAPAFPVEPDKPGGNAKFIGGALIVLGLALVLWAFFSPIGVPTSGRFGIEETVVNLQLLSRTWALRLTGLALFLAGVRIWIYGAEAGTRDPLKAINSEQ
ncbi:hypothetical protein B5C34_05260 [Pacificimonas flava]|uniref:Uncharacterized protein n=2 Tax=Pacificimonas TaxID=1960290 RepID=A0A219B3J2_9SPHN|nr:MULTISPECIES: hypothetical protein [Pacificimonas]MBZ6377372.1 hypothetical protein [Pacificimonas aurantium]OWV32920.1 hypothetical protein B5C34_05260 [Pacificimonas flava]